MKSNYLTVVCVPSYCVCVQCALKYVLSHWSSIEVSFLLFSLIFYEECVLSGRTKQILSIYVLSLFCNVKPTGSLSFC